MSHPDVAHLADWTPPGGLHRQTHPVGHASQLPTHSVPARPDQQLTECLTDERVALHPGW
jgi:hypothetical protein